MKSPAYLFSVVLFLFSLPAFGQGHKVYPVNEVHKDSALTNFVCSLQYAIYKKDTVFLFSVLDKNIKIGFGGKGGIKDFKEIWRTDSANSLVWFYLSKLISLGGTFSRNGNRLDSASFVFPYVFTHDYGTLDVFSIMAVTAKNVHVRQKPDRTSKIVGSLSYDIVSVDYVKSWSENIEDTHPGKEWYYLSTHDKKTNGYVYWEYVWSPVGYRMFLDKTGGEWKITALLAGD